MSLQTAKPFLSATPRQIATVVTCFGAFFAWYAYVQYQLKAHRAELTGMATLEATEFSKDREPGSFDLVKKVESNREFAVFGSEWGNVRVLFRTKGDATMKSFLGIELFYRHDGEKWNRVDTARMDDPRYWPEAYDAFVAEGHKVEDAAYEQALERVR